MTCWRCRAATLPTCSKVPSGSQTGLKLVRGFTLLAGGSADFTIDFDLRKSVVDPKGGQGMHLKPALRLIDNAQSGTITGTVAGELIASACADASLDAGALRCTPLSVVML